MAGVPPVGKWQPLTRWYLPPQGARVAGLTIALLLVADVQTAQGGRDVVTRYGPGSGTTSALGVNPTKPDMVYIGTSDGVFKSTDGGTTWSTSLNNKVNIIVAALAIDPITPSTLYAGGIGGTGFWKSTDAGGTWNSNGSLWGAGGLVIDPHVPTTLYGWPRFYCVDYDCSGGALFKSTDGGSSWKVLPHLPPRPDDPSISALAINPSRTATLYAVGTVTTGCRFTWDFCSIDSSVYTSTDGGVTWNAGARLGGYSPAFSLAIDPRTPAALYVGASGGGEGSDGDGVFKSTDGGASWSTKGLTDSGVLALAIDPSRPDALYANTGSGVFKTTDGGNTWNDTRLRTTGSISALAPAPSVPDTLYAAAEDGVSKSTDGGSSWNFRPGPNLSKVRALASDPSAHNVLYAVTTDGAVFRITRGGTAWNAGLPGPPVTTLAIDPTMPDTAYAGAGGNGRGGVFKTTDGGSTWRTARLPETEIFALAIDPTTPSTVYAGAPGGVLRSTDGGDTWSAPTPVAGDGAVLALAIDRNMPPGTLYAGTSIGDVANDSGVFKSTDGSHTWSRSGLINTVVRALTIDPTTPGTLYASSHDDGLFKSTDGGNTWCDARLATPSAFVIDPNRPGRLYAVNDSGLFKSTDGGSTWSANIFYDASALAIDPTAPGTLYVGTRGNGLFVIHEVSACIGDCGNSNAVSIDNLLTLVNIALGNAVAAACPAGDRNEDGAISVDEIIAAVTSAMMGCADSNAAAVAATSPTPTPAPFPTVGSKPRLPACSAR